MNNGVNCVGKAGGPRAAGFSFCRLCYNALCLPETFTMMLSEMP